MRWARRRWRGPGSTSRGSPRTRRRSGEPPWRSRISARPRTRTRHRGSPRARTWPPRYGSTRWRPGTRPGSGGWPVCVPAPEAFDEPRSKQRVLRVVADTNFVSLRPAHERLREPTIHRLSGRTTGTRARAARRARGPRGSGLGLVPGAAAVAAAARPRRARLPDPRAPGAPAFTAHLALGARSEPPSSRARGPPETPGRSPACAPARPRARPTSSRSWACQAPRRAACGSAHDCRRCPTEPRAGSRAGPSADIPRCAPGSW